MRNVSRSEGWQRRDFTERGLELVDVADANVGGLDWAHVRACVIRHGPATTVSPRDRVEAVAPPAFDHGAAVYLLADDDGSLQALVEVRQQISEAKKLGEHRFLLMGPASFPTALAETIARHDAGPAFQPLEIEGTWTARPRACCSRARSATAGRSR